MHLVQFAAEDNLVKFRDHLPGAKFAESTAIGTGRALRVLPGSVGEVQALLDLLFQVFTERLFFNQNVSRAGDCHVPKLLVVLIVKRVFERSSVMNPSELLACGNHSPTTRGNIR